MRRLLPTFAFAVLASAALPAQIGSTVGPPVAPLGCEIAIAFSNDTSAAIWTGVCPYRVLDLQGNAVYTPTCIAVASQVAVGATFFTFWEQVDDNGNQVPQGTYVVEVLLPGGLTARHTVDIDTRVQAGVANLGPVRPGTTRQIYACSPQTPSALYFMGASLSSTSGIPTCGGLFPLDPDLMLSFSLQPNSVFVNFAGTLSQGTTTTPTIAMPAIPALSGLPLNLAFFTFDGTASCPFTSISAPTSIVVQ